MTHELEFYYSATFKINNFICLKWEISSWLTTSGFEKVKWDMKLGMRFSLISY